jgi:hypothetical protein
MNAYLSACDEVDDFHKEEFIVTRNNVRVYCAQGIQVIHSLAIQNKFFCSPKTPSYITPAPKEEERLGSMKNFRSAPLLIFLFV